MVNFGALLASKGTTPGPVRDKDILDFDVLLNRIVYYSNPKVTAKDAIAAIDKLVVSSQNLLTRLGAAKALCESTWNVDPFLPLPEIPEPEPAPATKPATQKTVPADLVAAITELTKVVVSFKTSTAEFLNSILQALRDKK